MMLLLKCPGCLNKMKYSSSRGGSGKRKKCVYCGRRFKVEGNIVRKT